MIDLRMYADLCDAVDPEIDIDAWPDAMYRAIDANPQRAASLAVLFLRSVLERFQGADLETARLAMAHLRISGARVADEQDRNGE